MATKTNEGGRSRIPELEAIEFTGATSVANYSRALRGLARDMAAEVASGADEIETILAAQRGNPLLMGLDVRWRARRVADRLRRCAEACQAAAVEAVRFNTQFRVEFAEALEPQRRRAPRSFDFNS